MSKVAGILFIIILFNIPLAKADTITLKNAIEKALHNNYNMKAQDMQFKASKYAYKKSLGQRFPTLNASYTHTNDNVHYPSNKAYSNYTNRSNTAQLSGSLTIFSGNRISNEIKNSKLTKYITKYQRENYQYTLVYDVENAYIDVLLAEEKLKIQKMKLKDAQNNLKIAKAKLDVGIGTKSDLLTVEANLSEAQMDLEDAKRNYINTKYELSYYLSSTELFDVNDSILNTKIKTPTKIDIGNIRDLSPIVIETNTLKQAHNNIGIAVSKFLPNIDLNYSLERTTSSHLSDMRDANINLTFNIPIFTGFSRINEYQEKKLEYLKTQQELKDKKMSVSKNIKQSLMDIKYARSHLIFSKKFVQHSKEDYATTKEKFKVNLSTAYDLNDSQTNYYNALFEEKNSQCQLLLSVFKFEYLTENIGKYYPKLRGLSFKADN